MQVSTPRLAAVAVSALVFGMATLLAAPPMARATQGAPVESPRDAGDFLVALGEKAVGQLSDESLDQSERERWFRDLFNESFDVPAISRFVLGANWRRASEQEKADFLDVFEDVIVQRFLPLFSDYSVETFKIDRVRRDANNANHVFVNSTIFRESGEPVSVEWRVREDEAGYQILDIVAEGVSMAITLRQEYGSVVRQSGVGGLVRQLRRKVESGAFKPRNS